eukprot:gnl/TRDRNA2_/TRDRNA2_154366_c2_seq1.p1 gnl/TRDRNA2_/TRDRNA2_154366_c2~~gnl/TRDRNA2_/TRDRNA2_154366_c2_seq1.p1  ORF type:complete len:152 (+),score=34.58 gnl/TRDRNA2_/TRDRNA2_154366_c2_seq1:65-520(+)
MLVSKTAPGAPLADLIPSFMSSEEGQRRLTGLCKEVGMLLADFHAKYCDQEKKEMLQHRKFHPGNILYDEATKKMTVISLEEMGPGMPWRGDTEDFAAAVKQLATPQHAAAFQRGYVLGLEKLALGRRIGGAFTTTSACTCGRPPCACSVM